MRHIPRYLWMIFGVMLFICGLAADIISGALFLQNTNLWILLLHVPAVLLWCAGITLLNNLFMNKNVSKFSALLSFNSWGLTGLLLSLLIFPGLGTLIYSVALIFVISFAGESIVTTPTPEEVEEKEAAHTAALAVTPALDLEVQPLIDLLRNADLTTKRSITSSLAHDGKPESVQLLRQMLADTEPEVRSDASIALTRLEDELARNLNTAIEHWTATPSDKELVFKLADSYYEYACSNLLDEVSQHFYLIQARTLLQELSTKHAHNPAVWTRLARTRQRLGELPEALRDAQMALKLQPQMQEASLIALELAFSLHSWDTLASFTSKDAATTISVPESLQWWMTPTTSGGHARG